MGSTGTGERGILRALADNRRGRTTVVVAHRLGTVVGADRILVMDGSRLVETGTHADLWAGRGRYHDLFRSQAGVPAPELQPVAA